MSNSPTGMKRFMWKPPHIKAEASTCNSMAPKGSSSSLPQQNFFPICRTEAADETEVINISRQTAARVERVGLCPIFGEQKSVGINRRGQVMIVFARLFGVTKGQFRERE